MAEAMIGIGRNSELKLTRWNWIKSRKEVKILGESRGLRPEQTAVFTRQAGCSEVLNTRMTQ